MNVIIPMAGMGTRLRPLTLTTPKPLIKIAGKTVIEWLLENLSSITPEPIETIGFVIGNFPEDIKNDLKKLSSKFNAKAEFFVQKQPLGTAHAIYIAQPLLQNKTIIAFADTIFIAKQKLDLTKQAIIFTKIVDNPEEYGVVVTDQNGNVTKFIEKPKEFVSNQAIVGIYYFKDGLKLLNQIEYLISNNIKVKGEYQLTDALENLLLQGLNFKTYSIDHWLDTGNPQLLLKTNEFILKHNYEQKTFINSKLKNCIIIPPVYIGNNVNATNSVLGPYVSIEDGAIITNSIIKNSIIYEQAEIKNSNISFSIAGKKSRVGGQSKTAIISDFSELKI